MGTDKFLKICKSVVADYVNVGVDRTDDTKISEEDVFVVWCCKTLQNNKALLSTTIPDGMYYEFTYNGDKRELYVDAYKKWENFMVKSEAAPC